MNRIISSITIITSTIVQVISSMQHVKMYNFWSLKYDIQSMKVNLNALDFIWPYLTLIWPHLTLRSLKIVIKPKNFSCDLSNDKNPLDELFNVLNPTFKIGKPRYVERDLPDSFFNPKPRTFNPKREEAIRKEQIRHFQSLRRTRNPSSDKDKTKIEKVSLVKNDHKWPFEWPF